MSAITRTPVDSSPPAALANDITTSMNALGSDAQTAVQSLRLLRSGLGATGSDLYVFTPGGNAWCLFLWERQSTCPTAPQSTTSGALYLLSPGGPGYVGQPDNVPAAVVGIVADNIRSVALIERGTTLNLPIINNSFFDDLNEPNDSPFTVQLRFTYADGTTSTATLNSSGPIHLP